MMVILVKEITEPDDQGYASATVAEDESTPDWVDVEFLAPADRTESLAVLAARTQFSTERWTLTHEDDDRFGQTYLTYNTNRENR